MVLEGLEEAIENFNLRAETEEEFLNDIKGLKKKIVIDLKDGETYHMRVENEKMGDLGTGELDEPDIHIAADTATMEKLLAGEMSAIKAYALKKLKINASFKDMMLMRKIFS